MRVDLITSLVSLSSIEELTEALGGICIGAGMEHYLVVGLAGPQYEEVRFVHQNAPEAMRDVVQQLKHWSFARMLETMKRCRSSAIFGKGAEPGIEVPGYASGAAVMMYDQRDAYITLFASSAPALSDEAIHAALRSVTLTAAYSIDLLGRLHASVCSFTDRELQCLALVARGLTAKAAAKELGLSPKTVEHHLESSRKRCGAENTGAAVLYALGRRWIDAPPQSSKTASG